MKLFSRILGEGKPLVVVHGLFGMSDNWQTLAKQWADHFEVHLIDQRNHGRSPHSDEFSYEAMAADLLEYMNDHQLESVYLMGHSLGGKTAMQLAVEQSDRVEKLIVVDIAPKFYPVHHHTIIEGLESLNFSTLSSRGMADQQLSSYIPEAGVRQFLLKSLYWKEKGLLDFRFNLEAIAKNISVVGQQLAEGSVYNKPTLFIDGGDSNYIQEEDEDLIFTHFPSSDIETIDEAGHWVHAQQPQLFYDTVLRFLWT